MIVMAYWGIYLLHKLTEDLTKMLAENIEKHTLSIRMSSTASTYSE